MFLMIKWILALVPLIGAAAAVILFINHETPLALLVVLGALACAFLWSPGVLGRARSNSNAKLSAAEIRQYRTTYPGATIADAVSALSK
jgi:hypothetical protein